MASTTQQATEDRKVDLAANLQEIQERVKTASGSRPEDIGAPLLVAVSKYKPASDVLACFEQGQRDFGENYVQELVDKAKELPEEIRWHFIGTLQSNKAKLLASIPNLYAVQTLSSIKTADALNRAIPLTREPALNVLLQVNTSGEESKSGLAPLPASPPNTSASASTDLPPGEPDLMLLARHVIVNCPRLRLQGLMTIGSIAESLKDGEDENAEFNALRATRDRLQEWLVGAYRRGGEEGYEWGGKEDGRLLLSMGMSSDFEAALKAGSDIVRVGTGIFGERHKKGEN